MLGETDGSVRISRVAGSRSISYAMQEMAPQTIVELSEEMQEKDIENVQTDQEMKPEGNQIDLNRLKRQIE